MRRRSTALGRLSLVAGVLVVGLGLASCAQGGSGNDGDGVSLRYEFWDPLLTKPAKKLAEEFMKNHPDIDVEIVQTAPDQYFTRLQTAVSGENPPDVFTMNGPNFQLYASNGVLQPLDDYVEDDKVDLGKYPEDLVSLYSYEDEQFGLPMNFATIGLWYNEKLFDKAGVEHPTEDWTWADVKKAAAKITDEKSGVYGIAAGADTGGYMAQEGYYNTIYQAGGYVVSDDGKKSGFDDSKTIEGLQYWRDLLDAGSSPTYQQMVETPPSQMFQSGKVAMIYGGVWRASQWEKSDLTSVDVTRLPAGPQGGASTIHGTATVVAADTEHPDEAWEFSKFMASKKSQLALAKSGALIPAYEGTQQAWVDSIPEYNLQAYIDGLDDTVPLPISKNTTAWSSKVPELLAPAWQGKMSVEQAAKRVDETMESKLAEEE